MSYETWSKEVRSNVAKTSFGEDENPGAGIMGFPSGGIPTTQAAVPGQSPGNSFSTNFPAQAGVFTNINNQPAVGNMTASGDPASTPAQASAATPPPTDDAGLSALESSAGAIFGALAGTALGPAGTILGGGLGAIAQEAYNSTVSGNDPSATRPVTPPGTAPSSAPTPAQAAHDTGVALAHGAAKVLNGTAPAPTGDLSPTQEAARIITHGAQGAPAAVKTAINGIVKGTPAAAAGAAQGQSETGLPWGWIGAGVAGAFGLAWLFGKKR
jgi:hypothetical protein